MPKITEPQEPKTEASAHVCPLCNAEFASEEALLAHIAEAHGKAPEPVNDDDDPRRMVRIKLFKDSQKYKEPLFVEVNDYRAAIPRGVPVDVPYFVQKHIEEMQAQDSATALMVETLTQELDASRSALN